MGSAGLVQRVGGGGARSQQGLSKGSAGLVQGVGGGRVRGQRG